MYNYTLGAKTCIFLAIALGGFIASFMEVVGLFLLVVSGHGCRFIFKPGFHTFLALAIIAGRLGQVATDHGPYCHADSDSMFIAFLIFPALMWLAGSLAWEVYHDDPYRY